MNFSRNKDVIKEVSKYKYEPGDLKTIVTDNGLDVSFKAKVISDLLKCPLCNGFFRNATTIRECLHTFCRYCIINHIDNNKSECPKCDQFIGIYPLQGLVLDRTIQNITDKIFPQFREYEHELYKEFIEKYGISEEINNNEFESIKYLNSYNNKINEMKLKPKDSTENFYRNILLPELKNLNYEKSCLDNLKMKIKLVPFNSNCFILEKPYIIVAPQITIYHIQNYIMFKSNNKIKKLPVISLNGGVILPKNHSIEFVCRSRKIPLNNQLILEYNDI